MTDTTKPTAQDTFDQLSPYPWHLTLSDLENARKNSDGVYLVAVPTEKEHDIRLTAMRVEGGKVVADVGADWDPDEVADFCRTLLAILEERDLVDEDSEDD